jgi:hypothetical protein
MFAFGFETAVLSTLFCSTNFVSLCDTTQILTGGEGGELVCVETAGAINQWYVRGRLKCKDKQQDVHFCNTCDGLGKVLEMKREELHQSLHPKCFIIHTHDLSLPETNSLSEHWLRYNWVVSERTCMQAWLNRKRQKHERVGKREEARF